MAYAYIFLIKYSMTTLHEYIFTVLLRCHEAPHQNETLETATTDTARLDAQPNDYDNTQTRPLAAFLERTNVSCDGHGNSHIGPHDSHLYHLAKCYLRTHIGKQVDDFGETFTSSYYHSSICS